MFLKAPTPQKRTFTSVVGLCVALSSCAAPMRSDGGGDGSIPNAADTDDERSRLNDTPSADNAVSDSANIDVAMETDSQTMDVVTLSDADTMDSPGHVDAGPNSDASTDRPNPNIGDAGANCAVLGGMCTPTTRRQGKEWYYTATCAAGSALSNGQMIYSVSENLGSLSQQILLGCFQDADAGRPVPRWPGLQVCCLPRDAGP